MKKSEPQSRCPSPRANHELRPLPFHFSAGQPRSSRVPHARPRAVHCGVSRDRRRRPGCETAGKTDKATRRPLPRTGTLAFGPGAAKVRRIEGPSVGPSNAASCRRPGRFESPIHARGQEPPDFCRGARPAAIPMPFSRLGFRLSVISGAANVFVVWSHLV